MIGSTEDAELEEVPVAGRSVTLGLITTMDLVGSTGAVIVVVVLARAARVVG
jgi:hypothetical protein